jgi:hypothetical protein
MHVLPSLQVGSRYSGAIVLLSCVVLVLLGQHLKPASPQFSGKGKHFACVLFAGR